MIAALEHLLADSRQPYPLLFITVSGAHLYGFPSPDSDYDLRGSHILPLTEVVGLNTGPETVEKSEVRHGLEVDLVTHDIRKFFGLLLKRNGYVLEQLYSPLVLRTSSEHDELKAIAAGCITRGHAHHYLGFARSEWKLFEKTHSLKRLLYVYRVLLTGIHLMRTGEVLANLPALNLDFNLPYVPELIAQKVEGPERCLAQNVDVEFHRGEYEKLREYLELAATESTLPDSPTCMQELNDLLLRVRMRQDREDSRG